MYIGNSKIQTTDKEVKGKLVSFENEDYYKISNYDQMRPFFISVVSHSNHWLFISSNGGLSAGRKNSEYALFPYSTDDKITESSEITGSKTILQIKDGEDKLLWEPFSNNFKGIYNIERNLYKSSLGNKIVFEEINHDLELIFRYHWNTSSLHGFVKKSTLVNYSKITKDITILDGIQNIMPYGVASALQNASSNLVDAYKKNELEINIGLGVFSLSAIIVDKAEPSEALKAATVWSTGIEDPIYLISSLQLDDFRKGGIVKTETDIRAEKGAYFTVNERKLAPETEQHWMFVAEVNQTIGDFCKIHRQLTSEENLLEKVNEDVEQGSRILLELNAASDGLQVTADKLINTRHFSNTLFNIMRGGIFDKDYQIEKVDFANYIHKANIALYTQVHEVLEEFPETFDLEILKSVLKRHKNNDFTRLGLEYLPLKFSRRHGDPSRPWNKFSINTETEDGKKILDYQGNWRDIFQNWEALAHSYPMFIEGMIFKFLNATTFDGYNPYRIIKGGFDWETIEPDDPWSYIGYWGDHQIIYLLKFLEFIEKHFPKKLASYFNKDLFVYANVPYKIKSYEEILQNPKDTIDFDEELDLEIRKKRKMIGADAAVLTDTKDTIYKVNLVEKLLTTLLAKLSNFIPEGGIWMNTQRPEWNDANNALVGNGVSMVTLYYIRRFLPFFESVVTKSPRATYTISSELVAFFKGVFDTFQDHIGVLSGNISNQDRKTIMDSLGMSGSIYRERIYRDGFSNTKDLISKEGILQFIAVTEKYLDHSIAANKRKDNLFHSYNLMTIENETEVSIDYLPEMLEGQVAVLSANCLTSKEALQLLDGLKKSALFRHDQYSYILYPNKELPRFVDKNNIPKEKVASLSLVEQLVKNEDNSIIEKDIDGNYHFNGNFNNANSLKEALASLDESYAPLIEKESSQLLDVFEEVFNHKAFTGRSGTFFGYEGLGSIYWHMVSKLLLSVQETCVKAITSKESKETIGRLLEHYYEINEGIGVHKSPELHGAFPTDPYSHTPAGKGAQQPGMTGQVKEDILSRFGELGVFVESGCLVFRPWLLRKEEFLKRDTVFNYIPLGQGMKSMILKEGSIGFTYCQIPIVYTLGEKETVTVVYSNGNKQEFSNAVIDDIVSEKIFGRTGEVKCIKVVVVKG